MSGTWNTFSAPSGVKAGTMLLLTDGTVLVHDANRPSLGNTFGGKNWYRLTPDSSGDYRNGTWSSALPMAGQRKYFATGVLKDGRVFMVGGEYSDILGDTDTSADKDARGEIFDPVAGTWSAMNKPSPGFDFIVGDCVSIVLEDGRVLFGAVSSSATTGARTAIWDPVTDTWVEAGTKFGTVANTKKGNANEESWCLLPNGNVLTVQIAGTTATQNSEMYVPADDEWVSAGVTPSTLPVGVIAGTTMNEIGGAVTLMNGKAFFVGGSGRTALYTSGRDAAGQGHMDGRPEPSRRRGQRQRPCRPADLARRCGRRAAERPRADHVGARRRRREVLLGAGDDLRLRPGREHALDACRSSRRARPATRGSARSCSCRTGTCS